jgi:single-stranded DNA-binding protein
VGKITNRSWDDKDGNKKYMTEIVCSEMKMLGGKNEQQGSEYKVPQERKTAADNVRKEVDEQVPNSSNEPFDDSPLPF